MVSSKVGQRKKILKFEASQGSSSLQEAEGKYVVAQGGNASSTRLLRNGDGKCGLGRKCWNCWQVNPQAQLLKATALEKLIAVVLTFVRVFPPLENIQSFGEIFFLQEGERWGETS